jgi:uncharacterized protein YfaS (alpha-2-macroglobulin family)
MRKRVVILLPALLALPLLTWGLLAWSQAGSRDGQWKKVDEAMNKGLPKTAIELLDPIIAAAIKDKAYPEAIKAIARKIALEGTIQGNKPEEKIVRLKAEIAKAPPEMVPVMDAILANWYWHYFQQNRWRFLQRTATAGPSGDDILSWDLPRIFTEIDRQFTKALAADQQLKSIPIAQYNDLLEKGKAPDNYRPTLYDFLAFNALEFYSSGEQAAARSEDAFELSADSPIFAPADEFVQWKVKTTDKSSRLVKAIHLYQDLLRFHQNDKDKAAFLDADLWRLHFGYNKAFGEDKNARYKAALKAFTEKWSTEPKSPGEIHPETARATFLLASVLQQEGDLVEARRLAEQAAKAYPDSIGGKQCSNLIQSIEAKSSNITVERVWNAPWPKIQVRYRNLTKVHFRIVPFDFEGRLPTANYRPEFLNQDERKALLQQKPVAEWSADLPATSDFQERQEKLTAPQDLKPGSYFLIASHDPKFGADDNNVTFTNFWVSNLALVVRNRQSDAVLEGFVLDAQSGTPIQGAEVQAWYHTQNNRRVSVPATKTNVNGYFRFDVATNKNHLILVKHQGQSLASAHDFYTYRFDGMPRPDTRTVFFTDRSLYRPGQTIQFKGLCIRIDQNNDNYEVVPNRTVTVIFADHNGKEIARQQERANDYGSFSGSFTAPTDRLMGRMFLRVDGEPQSNVAFNVEEYKRPKFQVTLTKPTTAAKLNGTVTVPGKALAYSGAAIDAAKVRYRVVRHVRYPVWWGWRYWWRPMPAQPAQEIAHGLAVTGLDGSFKVSFVARPDSSVPEKDEPTFHFTVYADVTDSSGETRSGQVPVNVGYAALQATISAPSWLTADKKLPLTVHTTTLDGTGQVAEGSVKIYRLKAPAKVQRSKLSLPFIPPMRAGKSKEPAPDLSNPNSWPLGEVIFERGFTTDKEGNAELSVLLKTGAYRAILETQDRFGKKVTARLPLQVVEPGAKKLAIKVPHLLTAPSWTVEPGSKFAALWGTGYGKGRAYIEIEHRKKILQSYWTDPERTQASVEQAVTEAMRGGFTLRVTFVRENRAYLETRRIDVPWSNKDLKVRWERFTNKLEPGQKVTWTAVITGKDARRAVAEMVATLYDESLDAYLPHQWMKGFGQFFRQDQVNLYAQFENQAQPLQHLQGQWKSSPKDVLWTYRSFPNDIGGNFWGYQFAGRGGAPGAMALRGAALQDGAEAHFNLAAAAPMQQAAKGADRAERQSGEQGPPAAPPGPSLDNVAPRKNLNETAFFFPHLLSDKDGEVKLQFTMPEALTRWKFLGFAHDKALRAGLLEDSAVTARELMVYPNPPRFLREGDLLEFTVKVVNQSDARQTGTVRLTLTDARTGKSVDALLGNTKVDQSFTIPAKESRTFSWRLTTADDMGFLMYKAVAATEKTSDGEEGAVPVLSRRILVTESLPLPLRGAQTKTFAFKHLQQSGASNTLKHKQVTVQMVSNPNWYAVLALPYLMEYPYQCTEQTFNRLYANSLARHIANSDPKIRRVFDLWKGTPALDSPLMKNQDLRAVMLEETPWVRQAENESQARRNIAILFDDNRLSNELAKLNRQMTDLQLPDGAWPWFPGGPPNDYITLYITTGYGRLRHLGVTTEAAPAIRALDRLDGWIDRTYREILRLKRKDKVNLSPTIALYLYGRSFFLKDQAVKPQNREAVDYFLGQARKYWLKLANRQSQAHLALALSRFGDKETPQAILRSIKERAVTNEEMGMFWRDQELSWWWFRAPIETQAVMIEAFDEIMHDAKAVEDCKVWLLRQKQTRDWKTTKATADAVYALLLRGPSPLGGDALVEVSLGGTPVRPQNVEAGTGFYEKRYTGNDIKPEFGQISVRKTDEGVSWGSVTWQYLEDVGKVPSYEGTPLKLQKKLYTRVYTKSGPQLRPVNGTLKVGDELVVRLVLRVDRDMEYVHLKDQRGSGTEPVNVLSQYRYQDGLAYYESTRDTASHFFIDYLPKGTYVFEYSTRVVHRGQYQSGMAEIQCMYAPEFNSHSESFPLLVP